MILQAAFLGIVQGITEFLPISSTGHLILIPEIFGWKDMGLAFDVALHMGTLLALLIYFRREWLEVIRGFFKSFRVKPKEWEPDSRLAWMLVLATIPAAVAGAASADFIEGHLRTPFWVTSFLVAGSIIMIAAEVFGKKERDFGGLLARDAVTVGFAQVVAIVPGVSRSGVTISAGMLDGLNREAAARFAFLMAAPIIGGAGLWEAVKVARHGLGGTPAGAFTAGFFTSAVIGFLAIKFMLRYLRKRSLAPFIVYRLALAAAVFIYLAVAG